MSRLQNLLNLTLLLGVLHGGDVSLPRLIMCEARNWQRFMVHPGYLEIYLATACRAWLPCRSPQFWGHSLDEAPRRREIVTLLGKKQVACLSRVAGAGPIAAFIGEGKTVVAITQYFRVPGLRILFSNLCCVKLAFSTVEVAHLLLSVPFLCTT